MDVGQTMNHLDLQSEIVALAIVAIASLLILFLNRKHLSAGFREWRIQRYLNRIGKEQIRDLICPDGLEGHYKIDRLALTSDAILVIAYKRYVGNIYCAERISEWTQVIGQKSFKFENPLFELENQITAMNLEYGSAPLQGFLFFSHSAVFPKGHPQSVLLPDNIPAHFMRDHKQPVKEEVRAAWDRLKVIAREEPNNSRQGVKI